MERQRGELFELTSSFSRYLMIPEFLANWAPTTQTTGRPMLKVVVMLVGAIIVAAGFAQQDPQQAALAAALGGIILGCAFFGLEFNPDERSKQEGGGYM